MIKFRLILFTTLVLQLLVNEAYAQIGVSLRDNTPEHIFVNQELAVFEDKNSEYDFATISSKMFRDKFVANENYYPKNKHRNSTYWYRLKIKYDEDIHKDRVFEFFDQTADLVEAYIPKGKGQYTVYKAGAQLSFKDRLFQHKNFEFLIHPAKKGEVHYYFKLKSRQLVNVIIVYRTVKRFVQYTLTEYFTFGLFYGMILIFSLHNLLMYFAVKGRQYIYYVLYVLSVGLYEMSTDGIAFQYLWPTWPWFNIYSQGFFLCCVSILALIFTKELLHVKQKEPRLNRIINRVIFVRFLFFLFCAFFNHEWFVYKFLEVIPLAVAFFTGGWFLWKRHYRPSRFFVLGYSFLFIGFTVKVIYVLGYARFLPALFGHYSIGFGFIVEMIFLSFAIGDRVRILKDKKDRAQRQIIKQLKVNEELQQSLNRKLEQKVEERTREVRRQSQELVEKSEVISQQNLELTEKNLLLEQQAEEISRMNLLLESDNKQLKTNIEKVTDDRALSKEMAYEEFIVKYPDREACYKFLAGLKWTGGYYCVKCGHTNYCAGKAPYSRRCTRCTYEESVLHNTIFENVKISISKAFYLVYLVYYYKGDISSYKLAQKLELRQSTCWSYASKVKRIMQEKGKKSLRNGKSGWTKLVMSA